VDLDLVFLGTAASAPTAQRGTAALLVRRGGERLLVDCGEGTQRQLLRSSVGLVDLREVFLTHYHADHYLGLPGMMKTFALRGREVPLTIYGPPGLEELFGALRRVFGRLTYSYELETVQPGDVIARDGYTLAVFGVEHGVAAVGYALVEDTRPGHFDVAVADSLGVPNGPERGVLQRGEPVLVGGRTVTPAEVLGPPRAGRTVVIAGDSAPSATVADLARGADVLVHEATFLSDEEDRARETMHSTAIGAAELARDAGVQLLALTHISSRYGGGQVAREARTVFPETVVPKDFDTIEIPFEERGKPRLHKGGALDQEPGGVAELAAVPRVEEASG
jgi:ribonuclease Z